MPDLRPGDVFKPGGLPSVTYVSRGRLRLEAQLRGGLQREHSFTVVSGPSKTGKSVLCRRMLEGRSVLTVDCGAIRNSDEFWSHVAYKLTLPNAATKGRARTWTWTTLFEGGLAVPEFFNVKGSRSRASGSEETLSASYTNVPVLASLKKLKEREITLVIEDFHYLDRDTQRMVLRALKNAVADGLPVVLLAVPHRAFDPVAVESELAGRVEHVLLPSWSPEDLAEIPERGFGELRLAVPSNVQRKLCEDGFGSPLLVQDLCLRVAELIDEGDGSAFGAEELTLVYDGLVESRGTQRFERLAQACGPAPLPTSVQVTGGTEETLPGAILAAVARLGPKASTSLAEISASLEILVENAPTMAEITAALGHLARASAEGGTPSLEWLENEQLLVITDPYLLFHLMWQIKDRRTLRLANRAVDRLITGDVAEPRASTEDEQ